MQHIGTGSHYGGNYDLAAPTTANGSCLPFTDYPNFTPAFKTQMSELTQMYMDMARNTFFWAWKMGTNSTGMVPNPLWSYSLGLQQGWIPADPRTAVGACDRVAAELNLTPATSQAWTPPLSAWMTGGSGANTFAAAATSNYTVWPVASVTVSAFLRFIAASRMSLQGYSAGANLYTYTSTGTPITMSASPSSSGSITVDGWANPSDTASALVPVRCVAQ